MSKSSLRLLLVEDNKVNQLVATAMLSPYGYEVHVAENGEEGVEAVISGDFDMVLMDIQMPRMDGVEATQRIRALGGKKGTIPIIAVTAHAMRGDRESYIAAGMDDYVSKPINAQILIETIQRWAPTAIGLDPMVGQTSLPGD